jgi:hypothetical protein
MTQTVEPQAPVFTDEHPEFPKLLYNHDTLQTKAATDKEDQDKLEGEGFSEEPPPPDAGKLTDAEVAQLKELAEMLTDAAPALAKLAKGDTTPAI